MRVVNTRPAVAAEAWSQALRAAGHAVAEWPLVEIVSLPEAAAPLQALRPEDFDALFFSSPQGLEHFAALCPAETLADWMALPVRGVSPRLAPRLSGLGGRLAFAPARPSLAGFLAEFPKEARAEPGATSREADPAESSAQANPPPQRWLHPCSAQTRMDPAAFAPLGIDIHNLAVYTPRLPADAATALAQIPWMPNAVVFASGSAVRHFAAFGAEPARDWTDRGVLALSCGPSATEALREIRWPNIREAEAAEPEAVIRALAAR